MIVKLMELDAARGKQLEEAIRRSDGTFASIAKVFDEFGYEGQPTWRALMSLLLSSRKIDLPALLAAINKSAETNGEGGEGLALLIDSAVVKRYAKALGLRTEYEHILLETRLVSDIRLVFDEDNENPTAQAAIVNHSLRISYTGGDGEAHEQHFALDLNDLNALQFQISRALAKQSRATELIKNTGLPVLQPMEE